MLLNRRRFLFSSAVAATAVAAGQRVRAQDLAAGPRARIDPVTDIYFGQAVTDPYRWMEDTGDSDWLPWLQANDAHARTYLDALTSRESVRTRLEQLGGGYTRVSLPYEFGRRLLYLSQPPQSGWPVVMVRDNGTDRLFFDPGVTVQPGTDVSLEFWVASPDGRYLILGLGSGGSEEAVIHILDLLTGELLPDRIPRATAPAPYWLQDGSGFFYTQLGVGVLGTLNYRADMRSRLHRLGDAPASDPVVLATGLYPSVQVDPHDTPVIKTFQGSRWVLAETSTLMTKGLWCAELDALLAGRPQWRTIFEPERGAPDHYLDGDDLWIWGAINDEESLVSKLDLTSGPPFAETTLATIRGGTIQHTSFADDGLYLSADRGTTSQLFFVGRDTDGYEIPLPMPGAVNDLAFGDRRKSIMVHLSSWLEPASTWQFKASSGFRRLDLMPDPIIDTSAYEVISDTVTARDGAEVPVTILARRGLRRDGSAPCRVLVYGAYGQSMTADFDPLGLALMEQGGIQVIAHVRGGGENGRHWWMAGMGATKPNTWRDLIDVCEHLIAERWTSTPRLAIVGGSAGGIAVGRALTERPDLFGLVASQVGVLNPLRFEFEANGLANRPEFGSLETEAGFEGLRAMDTLHSIVDGTRYPTVLLSHGVNDARVAIWHSAKVAARLRAAGSTDSGPVLFRVNFDRGHLVDSVQDEIDSKLDVFAWLLSPG
ncbi:prolyl oligopeptidase family serine peptidase [Brevundimonas aveniformis]|uniref:prolyl oligopeptidase family serine peptidase n=1 Tax=Brevundimonas aveniformis TaxID=370977 RepID=UPI0003F8D44B|nr:prolyl oligopeptidase family serine peptidase [Brevundimonas aveniformis]